MATPELSALIPTICGWFLTGDVGPYTTYTRKNGTIVFYPRSPALQPPSPKQSSQRQLFHAAAADWLTLPEETRTQWELAAKRGSCPCTGFNLWVYLRTGGDPKKLRTLARQTRTNLGEF